VRCCNMYPALSIVSLDITIANMQWSLRFLNYLGALLTPLLPTFLETPQPAAVQSKQLFNPPFVHSIAAHPSGTRAAVGLGDGTVQFLHTAADPPTAPSLDSASTLGGAVSTKKNKKKAPAGSDNWVVGGRLVDAHSSPIATM